MCPGPLFRCLDGSRLVHLPSLGHIVGQWVVGIRGSKQSLNGQEDSSDLEGGRPVV